MNGSGRSASAMNETNFVHDDRYHACHVNVPGAVAGWIDAHEKLGSGKLTLSQILEDVVDYANNGFPVGPVTAYQWSLSADQVCAFLCSFYFQLSESLIFNALYEHILCIHFYFNLY